MKKLLSMTLQQKLISLVIILGILPTIGVLIWGIGVAIKSPELYMSDWDTYQRATPTPLASPLPLPAQQ